MKITFFKCTLAVATLLSVPAWLNAQSKKTADSLIAVINKQPDNYAAHQAFVRAMWKDTAAVKKQYQEWSRKFPSSPGVAFGFGVFYTNREDPGARPFLLKAVQLNPQLADAWQELAVDAERWGEFDKATEFLRKAAAAEPDNADLFYYYASSVEKNDPAKAREMYMELMKKFPESQRGAQALYWMAFRESDPVQKKALYERMKKDYPLAKFNWSASGMEEYFDVLLAENPADALKLATELANTPGLDAENKAGYQKSVQLASQLVTAEKLLADHKSAEAAAVLNTAQTKKWGNGPQTVALLKAKVANDGGHPQQAYDTLLKYYTITPARSMKAPLLTYGKAAGKTEKAVYDEVRQRLNTNAKDAIFSLEPYMGGGKQTMNNYKGKVVLLTFWFPGCGPCRGEFPHFEDVLKNFRGQQVSYIGVNIVREQDAYVVPFMKSSKYSFTPLKDVEANRQNLPVRGAPTNYLIDQNGKIIFKNFMIQNPEAELMLEDMIQLLLDNKLS